jgi:NADH-quinone oxidoreductase subunit E
MGVLPEELKAKIRAYFPRYPNKQAVTLPALHLVHEAFHCVSFEAMVEIAELLELAPAEVRDTMSFYRFFRPDSAPSGQTRVWVCHSLACALRGSDGVLREFCGALGLEHPGQTTPDGKVTLETAECLGACEGAPCLLINDEHRMNVASEHVNQLAQELMA